MEKHSPSNTLYVHALGKGLTLLESFSRRPGTLSLNELMELSGFDRSTTQRMVYTLLYHNYLERGSGGRGYRLAKKTLDRTYDFLRGDPLIERATPILVELQKETGERVDLSFFDDLTIIYVLRRQTKRNTFSSTLIGRRVPTYCNSGGRAVMASLQPSQVKDILERSDLQPVTPKTVHEKKAILQKVAEAKRKGYALAVEEWQLGEMGLASAILNRDKQPIGAIHISGSCSDWTPEDFSAKFAPLVISAARALHEQ